MLTKKRKQRGIVREDYTLDNLCITHIFLEAYVKFFQNFETSLMPSEHVKI